LSKKITIGHFGEKLSKLVTILTSKVTKISSNFLPASGLTRIN